MGCWTSQENGIQLLIDNSYPRYASISKYHVYREQMCWWCGKPFGPKEEITFKYKTLNHLDMVFILKKKKRLFLLQLALKKIVLERPVLASFCKPTVAGHPLRVRRALWGGKEEKAYTSTGLPIARMAFIQLHYVSPGVLMLRISSALYDLLSF